MATKKLKKADKEAAKIIAKQRKSLKKRESLIKKIDSIHKSVKKIGEDDSEMQTPISKRMIKQALKHLESAMLCIHQY